MHRLVSRLLLYSDLGGDSILENIAGLFARREAGESASALRKSAMHEIKRLLDLSTKYGFADDLWQSYLTYILLTNENSFSLTCERCGATEGGTVNILAKRDLAVFLKLMRFDFSELDAFLGTDCFELLRDYRAIPKRESVYNRNVSRLVAETRRALAAAADENEAFDIITSFYRENGVGVFAFSRAFRISGSGETLRISEINNVDSVSLSDMVGYEAQKRELRANTEAFISGHGANNVLLYGDSGTGKSTSVKALLSDYFDSPLRMIEIYKHQFRELGEVISRIKKRNYRFIIFIDDLSFEENEVEYKFLKAVIEGGVETRPDNILIYATSNRRHLIRETWNDRSDMEHSGDVHRSDTMEEKLSLASRFGLAINYSSPGRQHYHDIVLALARRRGVKEDDEAALLRRADAWEIRHGGVSGRAAQQFIDALAGQKTADTDKKD